MNAHDEETRLKVLAPDTTLALLKAWHAAPQSIVRISKMIYSSCRDIDAVNAIKEETPRECYNCGNRYPHRLGTTCPAAQGKECNRCHTLVKFASKLPSKTTPHKSEYTWPK